MELKKLERYYLRNDAIKELETYYKKEIGLGIAMVKFEEFQKTFTYAQHSFFMGMKEDHKVSAGDGNNERAKKEYQFYHLRHAILDYNACYDYLLQIVYFGGDFFDEIKSSKDYEKELRKCIWNKKSNFKIRVQEMVYEGNEPLISICEFYEDRNNETNPLADWANQLKHKGGFTIDELEEHHIEITILNKKTGETVFSSDYIKPICVSFVDIEKCLVYHNDKIVEYAEFLYKSLGLDDPVNLKKEFSANTQRIDTTDCEIKGKY